jgi:hypothetical protein
MSAVKYGFGDVRERPADDSRHHQQQQERHDEIAPVKRGRRERASQHEADQHCDRRRPERRRHQSHAADTHDPERKQHRTAEPVSPDWPDNPGRERSSVRTLIHEPCGRKTRDREPCGDGEEHEAGANRENGRYAESHRSNSGDRR